MDVGLKALRWERLEFIPSPYSGNIDGAVDPQSPVLEPRAWRRPAADTRKSTVLRCHDRHHRSDGFLTSCRARMLTTQQHKPERWGDHDRQQPGRDKAGGAGAGDDTEL